MVVTFSNRKQSTAYMSKNTSVNQYTLMFCWWSPEKPKAHLAGNHLLILWKWSMIISIILTAKGASVPGSVEGSSVSLVTARFVTRFNLWLRHDLWPHNASICDPARFVTKSASICDQRYTMILESKLCRVKLVFVITLIMYTKWYNMIIYMNYDMMLI